MHNPDDYIDEDDLIDQLGSEDRWRLGFSAHGGFCCGMTHIHALCCDEDINLKKRRRELLTLVKQVVEKRANNKHHLYEVVLTDDNIKEEPELVKQLKSMGFVLVTRFFNKNSSNCCNVLHYTHRQSLEDSPWNKGN